MYLITTFMLLVFILFHSSLFVPFSSISSCLVFRLSSIVSCLLSCLVSYYYHYTYTHYIHAYIVIHTQSYTHIPYIPYTYIVIYHKHTYIIYNTYIVTYSMYYYSVYIYLYNKSKAYHKREIYSHNRYGYNMPDILTQLHTIFNCIFITL